MQNPFADVFTVDALTRTEPGLSGAGKVGVADIPGVGSNDVQGALEELVAYLQAVQTVREERIYAPESFSDYSLPIAGGWNALPAPRITVPALGEPPVGTAWRVDVLGSVRALPASIAGTVLIGVALGTGPPSDIAGGGHCSPLGGGLQPVSAVGLTPPDIASPFEVRFYMDPGGAGAQNFAVRGSGRLRARVYLVKA